MTTGDDSTTVRAALVETYGEPPHYAFIPEPRPQAGQEVVDVLAVGVHPVTRGAAAGLHCASPERLPMVPGVDGVVRRANDSLAYLDGVHIGSTVVPRSLSTDPRSARRTLADCSSPRRAAPRWRLARALRGSSALPCQ